MLEGLGSHGLVVGHHHENAIDEQGVGVTLCERSLRGLALVGATGNLGGGHLQSTGCGE